MNDNLAQMINVAKTALAAIRLRGMNATACLENGSLDEAEYWLKLKKAAFHNFRAHDAVLKLHYDLKNDSDCQKEYEEIINQEERLQILIHSICQKKQAEIVEIRRIKENILKFKSQTNSQHLRVNKKI